MLHAHRLGRISDVPAVSDLGFDATTGHWVLHAEDAVRVTEGVTERRDIRHVGTNDFCT